MKTIVVCCALLLTQLASPQSAKKALIARGQYLVGHVAMCGDCHTPRDQQGRPIEDKLLRGALLGFKPLAPMPWAVTAPEIAGLPNWKDDDVVKFLMTGVLEGKSPQPPMPPYRFSGADARAVTAYLRSLGPAIGKPAKAPSATAKK